MSRPDQPDSTDLGFSLVEVLIALAIIAATTSAVFATIGQDARARRLVAERRLAVVVAQSALDNSTAHAGADDGQWRGLHWHVEREPYGETTELDPARLEKVSVAVTDAMQKPLFTLTTVQIKP